MSVGLYNRDRFESSPHRLELPLGVSPGTATGCCSRASLCAQPDARLVALTCQAHTQAFEVIVERYHGPLFRYCRRLVPDTRAEDVVQQTFFNAWVTLRAGSHVSDLRPWLYRVAHNAARDVVRRLPQENDLLAHRPEAAALPILEDPYVEVERRMHIRHVLAAINALPQRQREALLQTVLAGNSYQQIAERLGLSEDGVSQLVRRARAALRNGHKAQASLMGALTPTRNDINPGSGTIAFENS